MDKQNSSEEQWEKWSQADRKRHVNLLMVIWRKSHHCQCSHTEAQESGCKILYKQNLPYIRGMSIFKNVYLRRYSCCALCVYNGVSHITTCVRFSINEDDWVLIASEEGILFSKYIRVTSSGLKLTFHIFPVVFATRRNRIVMIFLALQWKCVFIYISN